MTLISQQIQGEILNLKSHYPIGWERSVLLEALWMVQSENHGFLTEALMKELSTLLMIPLIQIQEIVSFYHGFKTEPVQPYHVTICNSPPCSFLGGRELLKECSQWVHDYPDTMSIESVGCLGQCTHAPVAHIKMTDCITHATLQKILDYGSIE